MARTVHAHTVTCLAWHPEGAVLFSGDSDGCIKRTELSAAGNPSAFDRLVWQQPPDSKAVVHTHTHTHTHTRTRTNTYKHTHTDAHTHTITHTHTLHTHTKARPKKAR